MADGSYQKLQAVDKRITADDSHGIDAEACPTNTHNARTPSQVVEDPQSGPSRQGSRSSQPNTPPNSSVDIETCQDLTYNTRTPSLDVQDSHATHPQQGPYSSESTTPIDISVNIETYQGHTYNALTPPSDPEDLQDDPCRQDSRSSGSTTFTIASFDEGHPACETDLLQLDTPLNQVPDITGQPHCQEQTRHDDLGSGSQECAPDKLAGRQHPRWTMFYFRLPFLLSLSTLLALMIAGLEPLHHVSRHNQGLVTASESMHYAWTYGPTFGEYESTSRCPF